MEYETYSSCSYIATDQWHAGFINIKCPLLILIKFFLLSWVPLENTLTQPKKMMQRVGWVCLDSLAQRDQKYLFQKWHLSWP